MRRSPWSVVHDRGPISVWWLLHRRERVARVGGAWVVGTSAQRDMLDLSLVILQLPLLLDADFRPVHFFHVLRIVFLLLSLAFDAFLLLLLLLKHFEP